MQAQITNLAGFNGLNGYEPVGSLTLSSDGGTLYGTTRSGGANNEGEVFSVPLSGGAPTVLASFNGSNGGNPEAGLTLSVDGSTLYGTTTLGGASGDGVVFSVPVGGGAPTILASFNGTNGKGPEAGLTLSGSTLYGTTSSGGANNNGEVFSLPVGGGVPTVLASFNGVNGASPYAGLTLSGGILYGTTLSGGASNAGEVFSLPVGGGTPTVLASFNIANGGSPSSGLTLIGSTFYGTTTGGGATKDGVVFSLPVSGGTPTVLATFNVANGGDPSGELALSGNTLYGTTNIGGTSTEGVIFSVPVDGGTPTVIASFNNANGANPYLSGLILNGSNLYGTTEFGGASNDGVVFSVPIPAPEPGGTVLVVMGGLGLFLHRRRSADIWRPAANASPATCPRSRKLSRM